MLLFFIDDTLAVLCKGALLGKRARLDIGRNTYLYSDRPYVLVIFQTSKEDDLKCDNG